VVVVTGNGLKDIKGAENSLSGIPSPEIVSDSEELFSLFQQ